MKSSTKAIHCGQTPEPVTGAVIPPIFMTSTFAQESPGVDKGYDYTRAGNPTISRLEEQLASLENAKYASAFSSGLGVTTAILSNLAPGKKVLAMDGCYGGTYRLLKRVFQKFGVQVDFRPPQELLEALKEKPDLLFFETPSNPLLEVVDLEALCQESKKQGITSIVDNTFATPILQNPLDLGADLVLHSCTKYIGGHSDVIGGAFMTNHKEMKEELDFYRMSMGLHASPFDSWLVMRGVKTLAARMAVHEKNARMVAAFLNEHPLVEKVYYPGLEHCKGHEIAKKQMNGFGGMVSAEFKLSLEESKELVSSFRYFTLAESLGGVESLVCHPSLMTHASIPREERLKMGLEDGLIRFSVGIEDGEDLVKDLEAQLSHWVPEK